jgi:CO dehydrogenase/acetyl-CoA synthase gamma subunit (corrinoid Fe-S protein)
MSLKASLYTDQIDPLRYFTSLDCRSCGCTSCAEWLQKLQKGILSPSECPSLSPNRAYAMEIVLSLDDILPNVEMTQHPVQGQSGHLEVNCPGAEAPVLVTGNAMATQEVMMALLSTTAAPFHVLFVDCMGHTIDMAMIYGTFTLSRLETALAKSGLGDIVSHRKLLLPGLTIPLQAYTTSLKEWDILFGPNCLGEIPLYFGEDWRPPDKHLEGAVARKL